MEGHVLVKDPAGQRWIPQAMYDENPDRFIKIESQKPKAKPKAKAKER